MAESETDSGTTLWHAVLDFLQEGSTTRERLLQRFVRDPEREVLAVLNDLVSSGFVYSTGRGPRARYGTTSEVDRAALQEADEVDSLAQMMWLEVQNAELIARETLLGRFARHDERAVRALEQLMGDGRVTEQGGLLSARNFLVPLGAEQGWEAAALDHFQTMVQAIGAKLGRGRPKAAASDLIGGSTLHFSVYSGHPHEVRVLGLLQAVRDQVLPLWQEVADYNQIHPIPKAARRVAFYFGQFVTDRKSEPEA